MIAYTSPAASGPLDQSVELAAQIQSLSDATSAPAWKSYGEARLFARRLKLKSVNQWRAYARGDLSDLPQRPSDLPAWPPKFYLKSGWAGWGDFLGTFRRGRPRTGSKWKSFSEARDHAHALNLTSAAAWKRYAAGKDPRWRIFPSGLPANPQLVYRDDGWIDWGDFLGTGIKKKTKNVRFTYAEAVEYLRPLCLESSRAYEQFVRDRCPKDANDQPLLYSQPEAEYASSGWCGWAAYLGYPPLTEVLTLLHSLGIGSDDELQRWRNLNASASENRHVLRNVYGTPGWPGWGALRERWTAAAQPARDERWRTFAHAREYARSLNLSSENAWKEFVLTKNGSSPCPEDIPHCPDTTYAGSGWRGWRDFLGKPAAPRTFQPFEDARRFARGLGLRTVAEWTAFSKGENPALGSRPKDIPALPQYAYASLGWLGWPDFLGSRPRRGWRSFQSARQFVRGIGLRTRDEWSEYVKGMRSDLGEFPHDLPTNPQCSYSDSGWAGWCDFLGNTTPAGESVVVPTKETRPTESRQLSLPVTTAGLTTVPAATDTSRTRLTFNQARDFVRKLKLTCHADWRTYCASGKRPSNIPGNPPAVYVAWTNWPDFLGSKTTAWRRDGSWMPFEEARAIVRSYNLKNKRAWRQFCVGLLPHIGARPNRIPSNPDQAYRGKGWISYPDFLGTTADESVKDIIGNAGAARQQVT